MIGGRGILKIRAKPPKVMVAQFAGFVQKKDAARGAGENLKNRLHGEKKGAIIDEHPCAGGPAPIDQREVKEK